MKILKNNKAAFSLIEVLIVVFIAAVAFTAFYSVSMVGTRMIIEAKNRLAAVALLNEKMEIARNLSYDKIGTVGNLSIPGNIPAHQDSAINGREYAIDTSVTYFDDPEDGTVSTSPADTIPNDYKIVRVVISWTDSLGQTKKVTGTSRFVPPGLETNVGGSPLSVNIISNDGGITSPVDDARMHITNNSLNPAVDDVMITGSDGHIMSPAARVATGYHVTITKEGYETVQTMDTTPIFNPINKHIDVVAGAAGALNERTFTQNKLANLKVKSVDNKNVSVANIEFSINGGKAIGHDNLGALVYLMSNTPGNELFGLANKVATTDASGEKQFNAISPGNYNISMSENADYKFIDFDPSVNPYILPQGSNSTITIKVAKKNDPGIIFTITDNVDNAPIADAQITLTNNSGTEIFSGKRSSLGGIFFYPDSDAPFSPGSYTYKVEANGYTTKTETINVNGSGITELPIQLARN